MYLFTNTDDTFLSAATEDDAVVYAKRNSNNIRIRCAKDDEAVEEVYSASCDEFFTNATTTVTPYASLDEVPAKHKYDASILTEKVVEIEGSEELLTVFKAEKLLEELNTAAIAGVSGDVNAVTMSADESSIDLNALEQNIGRIKAELQAKYSA